MESFVEIQKTGTMKIDLCLPGTLSTVVGRQTERLNIEGKMGKIQSPGFFSFCVRSLFYEPPENNYTLGLAPVLTGSCPYFPSNASSPTDRNASYGERCPDRYSGVMLF